MTLPTPILLSDSQHEFVKANVAAMLEKEYKISNQSAGKLDYLAAVVMGFSNHQQRKALLAANTAVEGSTPPAASWPLGWLQAQQGSMTTAQKAWLFARGWFEQNDDGEYLDLEVEIPYEEEDRQNYRQSFNIKLTFDFISECLHLAIGDNLGDGFNEYINWIIDSERTGLDRQEIMNQILALQSPSRRESERAFATNFIEYDDVSVCVLAEVTAIQAWLRGI